MLEPFLLGEGPFQPTWRRVIHALHWSNEIAVARDILTYAEAVEDTTMTVENVTQVLNKIEGDKWTVMEYGVGIPRPLRKEIQRRYSTDADQNNACADYYVNYHPRASWQDLTVGLYYRKELTAARESKSFMSTDPTVTVDNFRCVIAKVEPNQRQQVWKSILVYDSIIDKIQNKYSSDLERETAFIDAYINCYPSSSWEHLAKALYKYQQVAAVEKVRSYLSPLDLTITADKLKQLFQSLMDPGKVDTLGEELGLSWSDRSKIQTNYHNPTQRKEAYLDQYVHHHPCPSWTHIADTLSNKYFGLREQADLVKSTYVKVSEKTQQCFDTAMMEGEVWLRNGSALLLGAGGSGKSHMLAILLEEDPPSLRESTPCAKKPVRTIAHCKVGVSNNRFVRITDDHYSDMLVATAEHFPEFADTAITKLTRKRKREEVNDIDSSSFLTEKESSVSELEPVKILRQEVVKVDALGREKIWCVRRAMKREHLQRMQEGSKKMSGLNDKDIVDFNDTAGQSMFHEILPVFIRDTMFGILTVKLNESLDGYPLVEYYTKGKRIGEPFDSPFTHLETIRHCMRVIRSTCDRDTCPKIAFVGTHKDLEHDCPDENREMKEKKLKSVIPPKVEDNIVTFDGSLLLAINTKSPQREDKASVSILREKLMNELHKLKPEKIPLQYVPLEMAFQRLAKDQRKSILSKEECFEVATTFNFTQESFEAALRYLHGLKLIFYYEEVLPDMVFINAQAFLDKITELVVYRLLLEAKSTGRLLGARKKFKQCGIVTTEILSEFDSHYMPNVFTWKELIRLFKHLRIMVEVREGEYLMPCVLKKEELQHPLSSIPSQVVSPLLFYFGPDGPMLGVYCFLLATLITEANWKLLEENGYPVQVSRNRARFVLPGKHPGCVTITDSFSTFFHVAYEPPEGVSADRVHQICEEVCPTIRETVLAGIRKASQKLNYRNSIPEVAFPCLKHRDTCMPLHPATIYNAELLICTSDARICSEMTEQHRIWKAAAQSSQDDSSAAGPVISPQTAASEMPDAATPAKDYQISEHHELQQTTAADNLGISDLRDVLEAVWEARVKWYNIGLKLGTPPGTLDSIDKAENRNPDDCITAMIKDWLNNGNPRPTWAAVGKALRSPMVGYGHLAEQLPQHAT